VDFFTCRYCDYLHGTVAVTAPQFLNVQPQSGAPASPSKGGLPALSAKSGKHASKKSSAKAKAASKAAPQAFDSGHLKYTVQEVGSILLFLGCPFASVLAGVMFYGPVQATAGLLKKETMEQECVSAAQGMTSRPMVCHVAY